MQHPQSPQPMPAKVLEIGKETVKLDLNHPLAGKKLKFDIELVKVE
ncbi:peptidylprolyl isomerase, partial [Candidatus Woesearchaeota archaeon]|nr:peptidylprolyl isomerase [Candidatus Woesearchaeota archaeon]